MPMRKKPKVVKENNERWLLTYSDLITLLLIFFIILYSMSSTNSRKFQDLTGALKQAFNNGAFQLIQVGGTISSKTLPSGSTPSERATYKKIQSELSKLMKELGLSRDVVHVGMSREGIVVTLSGNLLFYPGDIQLRPQSFVLLSRIALLVKYLPNRIRVEGNTDNQPSSSTLYSSNWVLSALRAVSVVSYLSGPAGLQPARLSAEGRGQYNPQASNRTPAGRAPKRRAPHLHM
jgi:chemotaxis protein MotB